MPVYRARRLELSWETYRRRPTDSPLPSCYSLSRGLIRIFSEVIKAMRIIWLDCRSEFSGEALVGALVDMGVSPSAFEWELGGVELGDHHLHFDREEIQDIRAVRFGVHGGILHVDHDHSSEHHHNHAEIELV